MNDGMNGRSLQLLRDESFTIMKDFGGTCSVLHPVLGTVGGGRRK